MPSNNENLKVNLKSIHSFQTKLGWKGSGTKADPIIIDSINGLKPNLIFKTNDLYIHFKDISLLEIKLIKCQNIKFENCKIYTLTLVRCQNISVNNCHLMSVEFDITGGNDFQHNRVLEQTFHAIKKNLDHYYKHHQSQIKWGTGLMLFSGVIIAAILYWGFISGISVFFGVLIFLFLFLFGFVQWAINYKQVQLIKSMPPNITYDNKIEDLRYLFDEIIEIYQ